MGNCCKSIEKEITKLDPKIIINLDKFMTSIETILSECEQTLIKEVNSVEAKSLLSNIETALIQNFYNVVKLGGILPLSKMSEFSTGIVNNYLALQKNAPTS